MKHSTSRGIRVLASLFAVLCVFCVSAVLAAADAPVSASEPVVIEVPDVRIVIDGVYDEYTDVPVNIDGRTMLPFREILENLGVENDDEHIVWNDEERSVTVTTGNDVIRLVVGNPVMQLNGEDLTFDAAPYIHTNNKTYVPVRAVSELLDKLVMWVDGTRTVYVRDKANFAETVTVLGEVQKVAPSTSEGYAADVDASIRVDMSSPDIDIPGADADGVLSTNMDMTMRIEIEDVKNMYTNQSMTVMDIPVNVEMYIVDGEVVSKVGGLPGVAGTDWEKTPIAGGLDYNSVIEQSSLLDAQFETRPLEDIAMAMASEKQSDGTYTLTGELLDIDLLNELTAGMLSSVQLPATEDMGLNVKIRSCSLGETLDSNFKATEMTMDMVIDMSMMQDMGNGNQAEMNLSMYTIMLFVPDNDFPQDYTLEVPAEALAALAG